MTKYIKLFLAVFLLLSFLFIVSCRDQEKIEKRPWRTDALLYSESFNYNIQDFGAKTGENVINTKAIQKAIDKCTAQGGGVVQIPAGKYVTGTIILKDNVTLNIVSGAELLGSHNIEDYTEKVQTSVEAPSFSQCLIYAEKAKNVTISGKGTVNGRGFPRYFKKKRPMLMRFIECNNLQIEDITLKNAGSWNTHLVFCDQVRFDNVNIHNRIQPNNDGIDFDGCTNVMISGCLIDSRDDAVCGKSTSTTHPCENIIVDHCIMSSDCSGFKLGTSSRGRFNNITVSNCVMKDCRMSAIKLLCVDGGSINNISFSNIVMDSVEGPLFIRLGARGKLYEKAKEQDYSATGIDAISSTPVGTIKNIMFSNIQASVVETDTARAGMLITGIKGHYIENVTFNNVHVVFPGGGTAKQALRHVPGLAKVYPEKAWFGILPAYGLYARHIKNMTLNSVSFDFVSPEMRPSMSFLDAIGLEFFHFEAKVSDNHTSLIKFEDVSDALFQNCLSKGYADSYLEIKDENCSNIRMLFNDFSQVAMPVKLEKGVVVKNLNVQYNMIRK